MFIVAKIKYNTEFKSKDLSADQVVNVCMTDYTLDVAANKIPSVFDGLKKVQRRAIWVCRDSLDKDIPMMTYIGDVLKSHQVGDMSVTNACMRIAQDFSTYVSILYGEGNIGRYEFKKGGAPRYLKIRISDIAKDLFYTGVNLKTLPMTSTMDTMGLEPAYFIPRLPTTLLFETLTIGVGTKSQILPMYFDNVCELVKRYIDEHAKYPLHTPTFYGHENLFIPDTPIFNTIRNTSLLLDSYRRGIYDASVQVDGEIEVSPNTLVIKTVPCTISFSKVTEAIVSTLSDKKSWLAENYTEYVNLANEHTKGALSITFKRNVNIFEALQKVKEIITFTTGIKPIYNFVNKYGFEVQATPPSLIDRWYKERYSSLVGGIKYSQSDNIKSIYEKQTRLLVADHTDEVIGILRSDRTKEEMYKILMDKFELSKNQTDVLFNTSISILSNFNKQALIKEIEALYVKAKNLKDMLDDVDNVIYKDAEYFQKKYHRPRIAKITPYIGYICYQGSQILQFDTIDEALSLLSKFPDSTIKMFCDEMPHRYLVSAKPVIERVKDSKFDIPKIAEGSTILESPTTDIYTLCIKDKTISCVKGLFNNNSTDTLFIPITEKFTGINKNGTIVKMNVKDAAMRKTADAHGKMSDLIYAIPACYKNLFIVHMNTIDPESIRFDYIKTSQTERVMFIDSGEEVVLGIIPIGNNKPNEFIFNFPSWCPFKFLYIKNFKKLQNNKNNFTCTINRRSKRNDTVRSMIEL